jgi:hypothetical protein
MASLLILAVLLFRPNCKEGKKAHIKIEKYLAIKIFHIGPKSDKFGVVPAPIPDGAYGFN